MRSRCASRIPVTGRATFLPEALNVEGSLDPQIRGRHFFKTVVYSSHLTVSGRFSAPDLSAVVRNSVQPLWSDAVVSLGVSDPRGIARRVTLNWAGADRPLEPGVVDSGVLASGLHARVDVTGPAAAKAAIPFSMGLELNGTRDLRILPAGNDTSVRLTSSWPHPGFVGLRHRHRRPWTRQVSRRRGTFPISDAVSHEPGSMQASIAKR